MLRSSDLLQIGSMLHTGSKKRWAFHPIMVYGSMTDILGVKYQKTMDEFCIEIDGFNHTTIEAIAYGHDMLKKIHEPRTVKISDTEYKFDVPDTKPYLMTDPAIRMITNTLGELGFTEEEIEKGRRQLIAVKKFHGLNAAAWMYDNGFTEPNILVPIMMHQCPVPEVYSKLPGYLKDLVDITILADKLSKNLVKSVFDRQPVPVFLHDALYGEDGDEFNYSSALLLAVIIQGGEKPNDLKKAAISMYKARCKRVGLPVPEKCRLGNIDNSVLLGEQIVNDWKEGIIDEYGSPYNEVDSGAESTGESKKEPDGSNNTTSSGENAAQKPAASDTDVTE